jgi:hypothetical protein
MEARAMANCPNCGSNHIQLIKETNVNWGRAVAGWALFGVIGGAVGSVTGKDRSVISCLNCGTIWKAADLFKTLNVIKNLTGKELDLSIEKHRFFMDKFMSNIGPYLEKFSKEEKRIDKVVSSSESKFNENQSSKGFGMGCMTSIVILFGGGVTIFGGWAILIILLLPLIGAGIGNYLDSLNLEGIRKEKEKSEEKLKITRKEAAKNKLEAKEKIKQKIALFLMQYPL